MDSLTVLARLARMFPGAKTGTLRRMVAAGRVRLGGAVVRSVNQRITPADTLEVSDQGAPAKALSLRHGLRLVHGDGDILVVDKPAGLLTATDAQERRPTVWRILLDHYRRQNHRNQVHLIHRLDRDASGLLVFARTREAFTRLKKQFFEHTTSRQYEVLVHGIPKAPAGRLEHLLVEDEVSGQVRVTASLKTGRLAILDYEVLDCDRTRRLARLRCTLFTGRKHQIRVQLSALGHPVCGDPLYGKADEPPYRLALHAVRLALDHPRTGKRVAFESPAPRSFGHLVRS